MPNNNIMAEPVMPPCYLLEDIMACPECGCKVTYEYDDSCEGFGGTEGLERCAACGHIFDFEDSGPEEDDDCFEPSSINNKKEASKTPCHGCKRWAGKCWLSSKKFKQCYWGNPPYQLFESRI